MYLPQVPTGTTEEKRTTVPFMYNMELDDSDQGLDVVDFPGVDDEDDSIPDLADLLLTITQIVIFVVDYRYIYIQYKVFSYTYNVQVDVVHIINLAHAGARLQYS